MANLTADHYIANVERFQELLLAAYEVAQTGELVTLGITPRYADTGYGYIQRGASIGTFRSFEAFQVGAFKEKPDQETAEAYCSSGDFAWNSGMFVWKAARIVEEMQAQMPDLYMGLMEIEAVLGSPEEAETIHNVWQDLESETIDYGIMEGADRVVVIPADDLGWWDVGGWGRLFELLETDELGNLILAEDTVIVETKRSLVFQEQSVEAQRFIATLGLENIVVIDMGDVLFVCHRDYVERVRDLVGSLADSNRNQYL
jgi:mannose-1-phosphate guanylyltransferase